MPNNKFDPNTDIPDLSGKTYVVTGGSAGIGFGICAHLLQHNCERLYILSKKEEHLADAEERLKEYGDVSRVKTVQVELEDLHSVDTVAKQLAEELEHLHGLVLNAGLGVGPYAESKDGIEVHMQVNVIAQHHLMMILLPLLRNTPDSRLVLQASEFHRMMTKNPDFASVEELNKDIGPSSLYARSKLAQVLQVRYMYRLKHESVNALELRSGAPPWTNATHPGGVVTDQQDQAVEAYGTMGKLGVKAARLVMKDPTDEGCRPALFAATATRISSIVGSQLDGNYIVPDCKVSDVSKEAQDEKLQENLWRLVETILKDKLGPLPYKTELV